MTRTFHAIVATPAVTARDLHRNRSPRSIGAGLAADVADPPPDSAALVFPFLAEHPDCLGQRAVGEASGDARLSPDERAALRRQLRARAAASRARVDAGAVSMERSEPRGRPAPMPMHRGPGVRPQP